MSNLTSLTEKLIIFICCILAYCCQTDLSITVVTVLASVTFSSLLSYFEDNRIRTLLTSGFSIAAFLIPELTFFLPLIAYDMLFYKYQFINIIAVFPLLNLFINTSLQTNAMVIITLLLCVLAKYRHESLTKLQTYYTALRDQSREMSIRLEKQNQDLMEKQDNEIMIATFNERNRIAREIHDNVGHLLSSAILQSAALLTLIQDKKAKEKLKNLNDTLSQAMDSTRTSIHELYEESIDLNEQVLKLIKKVTSLEVEFHYNINRNPEKKLKYAFISIIKEGLANIMKHSNATRASIILREHPALYQLIIRDNGSVKNYRPVQGLGLKNMMDRVNSFNGNINISNENGFEIFISIPKEASYN
jgi:signal transduction histidine kinase